MSIEGKGFVILRNKVNSDFSGDEGSSGNPQEQSNLNQEEQKILLEAKQSIDYYFEEKGSKIKANSRIIF
jgi:hypothetical protein